MTLAVNVVWSFFDVSGVLYRVERKEAADVEYVVIEENVDRSVFMDTTVEYGKLYMYKITAKLGEEDAASTIVAVYTVFPPPGAVYNISTQFQEIL